MAEGTLIKIEMIETSTVIDKDIMEGAEAVTKMVIVSLKNTKMKATLSKEVDTMETIEEPPMEEVEELVTRRDFRRRKSK